MAGGPGGGVTEFDGLTAGLVEGSMRMMCAERQCCDRIVSFVLPGGHLAAVRERVRRAGRGAANLGSGSANYRGAGVCEMECMPISCPEGTAPEATALSRVS